MRGAPTVSGTAGTMIDLLDACLITGFGLVSVTSINVAAGVATATVSAGNSFDVGAIVWIDGATPAALNGEARVLPGATSTTFTFATTATDGVASGTITAKYAPVGGWEKSFSGTNKAVYKSIDPQANGHALRVWDAGTGASAQSARVVGYESMTDVDTGSAPFPTEAQISGGGGWYKSASANSTAVSWRLFGDSRFFLLCIVSGSSVNPSIYQAAPARGFGDAIPLAGGGDAFSTVLSWSSASPSSNFNYCAFDQSSSTATTLGAISMPRGVAAVGSAVMGAPLCSARTGAGAVSGGDTAALGVFPSEVDGKLRLAQMFVADPGTGKPPRALIPGIYYVPHSGVEPFFENGATVDGTDQFAGRRLIAIKTGSIVSGSPMGLYFVDATGPWR